MFGDAWSNPLIYSFDAYNKTVKLEGCYFDLDGSLHESYSPIGLHIDGCRLNLTNY
jgi:hypothetical protein